MAVVGGHTNPGWALVKHHIQEQQTPIFSEAVNSANRLRKNRSLEELTWTYFYRSLLAFMEAVGAFGLNDLLTSLFQFRDYFEQQWGRADWPSPEELIREMRRKARR